MNWRATRQEKRKARNHEPVDKHHALKTEVKRARVSASKNNPPKVDDLLSVDVETHSVSLYKVLFGKK